MKLFFFGEFTMSADQTLVTSTEQKKETTDKARNVDDRSSRSGHLQAMSNVLQRNEDVARMCKEEFALNNKKRPPNLQLLNSEFRNFKNKQYTTYYKVPEKYSPHKEFYDKAVPFKVDYIPSAGLLNIVMPVKFMGPTNLKVSSNRYAMTAVPTADFMGAYISSVNRVWSGKYQLYLNAVNPEKNESCDTWANLDPVKVCVLAKRHEAEPVFYKVFYIPKYSYPDFRDTTGSNGVAFSDKAYDNRLAGINENGNRNRQAGANVNGIQNIFAHEFGHQIGLGDEYAIDNGFPEYTVTKSDGTKFYPVYKEPVLEAYESTESDRFYILHKEGSLFNHEGVDYAAEKMTFEGKKKGYILKRVDTNEELETPLEGLKSKRKPQIATDTNGKTQTAVYFYDGLQVTEKPGLRKYNFEKFLEHNTEMYHNSHRYKVIKENDVNEMPFYYLMDENNERKKKLLDGVYTTHTKMVEEVFGEEYALENATIFDKKEHENQSSQFKNGNYVMNEGSDIMPHHYITFEYGMVNAIQSDSEYGSDISKKAPNMEGDWIIK